MDSVSIIARPTSVVLAVAGAVCLAVAATLLFLWVMDQSETGASAVFVAGGLGVAAAGALCVWLSRRIRGVGLDAKHAR